VIDETQFADVYSVTTGIVQRVSRVVLDDPILGRDFRRTPAQLELDGELPPRPAGDAKAAEIDAFAEAAGIDLTGVKKNADKLAAIETALGNWQPVQQGVLEEEAAEPVEDPLAPEKVAHVDPQLIDSTTTSSDGTGSSDETPATGDEE
jgi:hypothetical protein